VGTTRSILGLPRLLSCAVLLASALASRMALAEEPVAFATAEPGTGVTAEPDALAVAVQHADAAEFDAALRAFGEAAGGEGLTRADLVVLFGHRAVVCFALGDGPAMEADLARLVALDATAHLPASAPPPVREAFERMRALGVSAPRLEVTPLRAASGVRFMARVHGGPADLVTAVRVYARPAAGGTWKSGEGQLALVVDGKAEVQWYAEGIGPGGAVVVSLGARASPEHFGADAFEGIAGGSSPRAGGLASGERSDGAAARTRRRWLLGAGGVIAVGAAVAAAVLLASASGGGDLTQVGAPILLP
jgi:hypothetical protein